MTTVVELKLRELLAEANEKKIPQEVIDERYPYVKMTLEAAYVQYGETFIQQLTFETVFNQHHDPQLIEDVKKFGHLFTSEMELFIQEKKTVCYYNGMVEDIIDRIQKNDPTPTNKFLQLLDTTPDVKSMIVHIYKKYIIKVFQIAATTCK
jgi:predicted transport protein